MVTLHIHQFSLTLVYKLELTENNEVRKYKGSYTDGVLHISLSVIRRSSLIKLYLNETQKLI